jgi:hypothetical protein
MTFGQSLRIFLNRWDIKWLAGIAAAGLNA